MIGNEFYVDVASIIQRVCSKTDNMKTNRCVLLNKISGEMNELILKAQEVIKMCLTDRNNFLKDVESIQNDFVELSKKMELKQALEKEKTVLDSPTDIQPSPRESKLHTLFGDSDEDEDSVRASERARKNVIFNLKPPAGKDLEAPPRGLRVPETLGLELLEDFVPEPPCKQPPSSSARPAAAQVLSNQKGFTIRETMDPRGGEDFDDSYSDSPANPVAVFPPRTTTSRTDMNSLSSKKVSSTESIISCHSSTSSSKTPKKSSTSTPRKHNAVTPSKQQAAAIANSNKKIDQFFKKKGGDSPQKNHNKVQVRSITADLNAVRKTTVSQEQQQQAKSSMVTRSGQRTPQKSAEKANSQRHHDTENDEENCEFEETFVDEALLESIKSTTTAGDYNIKQKSYEYENEEDEQDHHHQHQKNSKRTRKKTDSDHEGQSENQTMQESDQDYFANFDKVPKKKSDSPGYKHVEVVRNKDKRKKLGTSTCKECENYWNSVPEDRRPKRMDEVCRHRAKYQAPSTPEHFWEVEFPTTQQCIDRGYGGAQLQNDNDDSIAARRPRRKRPLTMITNRKTTTDTEDGLDFGGDN